VSHEGNRIIIHHKDTRILPSQTDVHWIEEELLRLREEVFLRVLERVMLEIEREVLKRERRCERCGMLLVRNWRDARRIKTLVGEVKVNRVRLRCQGCGEENYPLDQAMGLGSGERMTLGVREGALVYLLSFIMYNGDPSGGDHLCSHSYLDDPR
jgi:formylmethanofuran dehydrogenase subunit E